MKRFLFLITLLTLMGGANSYATKKYATLSAAINATWDSGTNTMGWKSTSDGWGAFSIINTGLPNGNISAYTSLHATLSNFSENADFVRLRIKDTSDHYADYKLVSGENIVNLADLAEKNPSCNFESIKDITIWGSNSATAEHVIDTDHPASVVITNCYMEKPFVFAFDETGTAVVDVTDLKAWGCLSINPQTGVVTNSYADPGNTDGYLKIDFSPAVDMSNVYGFKVNYTGDNILDGIYVNDWEYKYGNNIYGRNDIAASMAGETSIEAWIWGARNTTGSLTISSVEFYSNVITANPGGEKAIQTLERKYYEGGEWKTGTVNYSYGNSKETVIGDGSATQDEYIDLSGYNELRMYVSSGDIRVFAVKEFPFTSSADGYIITKDGVKQNGQWNGIQDAEHKLVKNGDYYYITIDDLKAACGGQAKLIGVKAEYGNTVNVSKVTVIGDSEFNYSISGNGVMTASATAALADATATSYDATGVTGTGVDFTSVANPNALFKANAGVLANTKNVIVDDDCANLVLTDGYPFKAAENFTADAATYTRDLGTAGAATLCLPFAAAIPDGVTAYTLEYSSGDKAAATLVNTTIPANTPVLLNGSGEKTFSGSGAVSASATNVVGSLTGVFASESVPTNSYVLQKQDDNVGFYKVNTDITIPPFRAYLTADADARGFIGIDEMSPTGVNEVKVNKAVAKTGKIYNLNGQIVSKPTKGLYIVDGKVVSF